MKMGSLSVVVITKHEEEDIGHCLESVKWADEIIVVDDTIRSMVVARAPSNEIKQKALQQGMRTLRDDGWDKVLNAITTVEEVLRVTEDDEALTETYV